MGEVVMTFKQVLSKAKENNILAYKLVVATEVDNYLDINEIQVSEDTYEAMCEFVYDWVLNTDASANEVVDNLVRAIKNNDQFDFTVDSINDNWQELTDIINRMF
jgi:hypothetical protein